MKWKLFLFILILLLFIFQNSLQTYLPVFSWTDKIFSYFFIPILVFQAITSAKIRIPKTLVNLFPLMFGICLLGLISNLIFKYQSLVYALEDLTIVFKFIFAFVSTKLIFSKFDLSRYEKTIYFIIRLLTILFFCATMAGLVCNLFPCNEIRYGIKAQQIWYSHPTYLASSSVLLISLLTLFNNKYKANFIYIMLLSVVILATVRSKAIAFLVCYFIIIIYFRFLKGKSLKFILLFLGLLAFWVGFGRIKTQLIDNDSYARAILYKDAIVIAKDHFPLGSGFGTYAGIISGRNYSPIYYKYNIDKIYGLSKTFYHFICDTFWPMIIGQFGYFGLILFCLIIYEFIKLIWSNKNIDQNYFLAAFLLIFYLIITSTSESSFANYYAVHFFFLIGIITNSLELKQPVKFNPQTEISC